MGAVAGRANAGDQIVLVNIATGATRTVTATADGNHRAAQLPVGDYRLQVVREGHNVGDERTVNVSLGGTTTVNLGAEGDVVNLDQIVVTGDRIINRVDVFSTESATNITRAELARMPVDQSLGAVALLAPGVVTPAQPSAASHLAAHPWPRTRSTSTASMSPIPIGDRVFRPCRSVSFRKCRLRPAIRLSLVAAPVV